MKLLALTTVYIALLSFNNPIYALNTHTVHSGQSIQAAINSSHAGDQIIVEAGTYPEQLIINKDNIALIGHNAVIVPPSSFSNNTCSGLAGPVDLSDVNGPQTQAGICIAGPNITLGSWPGFEHKKVVSVGRAVRGVTVTGFTVKNFNGLNIAIVGAEGTAVNENTLIDGGGSYTDAGTGYGILTVGSKRSRIERNSIQSSSLEPGKQLRFIGICMDDVGLVVIQQNNITGYNIALCVSTNGAHVHDNNVNNCCIGAFVDPSISGAIVRKNEIKDSNPACENPSSGAFGVWGVAITGAANTLVQGNQISGMTNNGVAGGIVLLDDVFHPDSTVVAMGNAVERNTLSQNDIDIYVDTAGTGNFEKDNKCKTSSVQGIINIPGVCKK